MFWKTISSASIYSSWPTDHDEISSSSPIWSRMKSWLENLLRTYNMDYFVNNCIAADTKTTILNSFFTKKWWCATILQEGMWNICWLCALVPEYIHISTQEKLFESDGIYSYSSMISKTTGHQGTVHIPQALQSWLMDELHLQFSITVGWSDGKGNDILWFVQATMFSLLLHYLICNCTWIYLLVLLQIDTVVLLLILTATILREEQNQRKRLSASNLEIPTVSKASESDIFSNRWYCYIFVMCMNRRICYPL